MRLFSRALLAGVLLPAAFSHALYSSLGDRGDRGDRRNFRVERDFGGRHAPHAPHPPRHGPQWAPPPPPPPPPVAWSGSCAVSDVRVATMPASVDELLAVRAGSGDLSMEPVPGLDRVEVEATLCAPSRRALSGLGVSASREDGRVEVGALDPDDGDPETRVDLIVRLPLGMKVTIQGSASAPPDLEALGF